jgi:four helix bundle protein
VILKTNYKAYDDMVKIQSYRELEAWQKSINVVELCYILTKDFPKEELYSLTNQIRSAAISIPSNIAEGQSRWSTREFLRFLSIAKGSLSELETQLILAQRIEYLSEDNLSKTLDLTNEIGKMISGLRKKSLIKKR